VDKCGCVDVWMSVGVCGWVGVGGFVGGAHPCRSHAKDDRARLFLHVAVIKLVPRHLF
jgi:hypothetical protein